MKPIIYFIFCIILSSCAFAQSKDDKEPFVVVSDGTKVPLKACIEANKKIMAKSVDVPLFCECFVPKFYEQIKGDAAAVKAFEERNWFDSKYADFVRTTIKSCFAATATTDSTAKFVVTPRMAETMKRQMKKTLVGTEIETTNDVDKYCDCVIEGIGEEFTTKEIMETAWSESEKYGVLIDKCQLYTRKNK
jgi:hypothetical protein